MIQNTECTRVRQGSRKCRACDVSHVLLVSVLLSLLSVIGCAARHEERIPEKLGLGSVQFNLPHVQQWTLPNGLQVFYSFDNEIPMISGQLYIPGGNLQDPENLSGLAAATAAQLRDGGIRGMDTGELNKRLDALGANVESGASEEFLNVGFSCLEEDFPEVFSLFGRFVRDPNFDAQKLDLWKGLAQFKVRQRRDDPDTMAGMLFTELLYGSNNAWSRSPSEESLGKIRREDLIKFHQHIFVPDHAILAIAGAVPEAEVRQAIEKAFALWPMNHQPKLALPPVGVLAHPGVYVIDRDFEQASILSGHRGPTRFDNDNYALTLYNRVFGAGDFGSTLFLEIRSRLGLAYSVSGGFLGGPVTGIYEIELGTRISQVSRSLSRLFELVRESAQNLPAEDQFSEAKAAVERNFVFKFAKTESVVERAALQSLLGYREDYDRTYLSRLDAIDRAATLSAAQRWVHPEQLVTVVVGKVHPEELARQLGGHVPVYRATFDTEPHIGDQVPAQ